jgi:RNA polymerase sigma factor for flagellar operon FliA
MSNAMNAVYEQSTWSNEERERVLLEQLPQVKYIARRIHERLPQHVALEDLVHSGVVGLIDALNKFDACKHVQFASYAKHRIRGAILDSLRELDWGPRELRRRARVLDQTHAKLDSELGRSATEQEIAVAMGLELAELQHLLGELDSLEISSFSVESAEDGKEADLSEALPAPENENPFQRCLDGEMRTQLIRALMALPERERQVLTLYYYEELTMKEVGVVLGVGESRVSQIHSLAMSRLRSRMQTGVVKLSAAMV